jgi:hypothetical protein
MTSSYGGDPYSATNTDGSKVDTVRLLLGINRAPWEMTDEEIEFFISEEGNPSKLYFVCHHIATSIASSYSNQANRSMGPLSISLSQKFDHWMAVAEEMYGHATRDTTITPSPFSGTSQVGDRADTSDLVVKPSFVRDMFDNYGTGTGSDPSDREHFQP